MNLIITNLLAFSYFVGLVWAEATSKYDTINKYLVDHVGSEDPEANLLAAKVWFEFSRGSVEDTKLLKALQLFTSLSETTTGDNCGNQAYNILADNDRETGGKAHDSLNKLNRVERVVNYYCSRNARECKFEYPLKFSKIYPTLDKINIKRVESYINDEAIKSLLGVKIEKNQPNRELYRKRILDSSSMGRLVVNALIISLKEDRSVETSLPLQDQIKKYIIEPCQYYDDKVGLEIFLPAGYSYMWNFAVHNNEQSFYYGYARFRICRYTIDNQDLLERDVLEALEHL